MTIDTIQLDWYTIYKHLLAYHSHITEANLAASSLYQIGVSIKKRKYQCIQSRSLRSPFLRIGDILLKQREMYIIPLRIPFRQDFIHIYLHLVTHSRSGRVIQHCRHLPFLCIRSVAYIDYRTDPQLGILIFIIKFRTDTEIINRDIRPPHKHHISMDTCHSPMVSIFKIASVCPFEYPDSQSIFTLFQNVGNIELTWKATVLGIAYSLAVHPHLMA